MDAYPEKTFFAMKTERKLRIYTCVQHNTAVGIMNEDTHFMHHHPVIIRRNWTDAEMALKN
uniref:Uncharacterized protein n=1 Tax=Steinernema glaseri TaxID=37863 RepID=A0A1I7YUT2_9BILA